MATKTKGKDKGLLLLGLGAVAMFALAGRGGSKSPPAIGGGGGGGPPGNPEEADTVPPIMPPPVAPQELTPPPVAPPPVITNYYFEEYFFADDMDELPPDGPVIPTVVSGPGIAIEFTGMPERYGGNMGMSGRSPGNVSRREREIFDETIKSIRERGPRTAAQIGRDVAKANMTPKRSVTRPWDGMPETRGGNIGSGASSPGTISVREKQIFDETIKSIRERGPRTAAQIAQETRPAVTPKRSTKPFDPYEAYGV